MEYITIDKIKDIDKMNIPDILRNDINELLTGIENSDSLIDCYLSQLLGDINMAESWGLINGELAKELRKTYIDDIIGGKYGQIL